MLKTRQMSWYIPHNYVHLIPNTLPTPLPPLYKEHQRESTTWEGNLTGIYILGTKQ